MRRQHRALARRLQGKLVGLGSVLCRCSAWVGVGGRGSAGRVLKQGSACAREQVGMRPVLLDSKKLICSLNGRCLHAR